MIPVTTRRSKEPFRPNRSHSILIWSAPVAVDVPKIDRMLSVVSLSFVNERCHHLMTHPQRFRVVRWRETFAGP